MGIQINGQNDEIRAVNGSGSVHLDLFGNVTSDLIINSGHIGVGTDDPTSPVHTLNPCVVHVGIVSAHTIHGTFHGDGSNLTGVSAFVTGMIMMYTGATAPSGWALCDGQNGTPDLRDRFIISSGSTYNIDATGGSADAIVVSHTHTLTDPGHTHTYSRAENVAAGSAEYSSDQTKYNVDYGTHTTDSGTTGISVDSAGSSGTGANLPPYYALAFIMKL